MLMVTVEAVGTLSCQVAVLFVMVAVLLDCADGIVRAARVAVGACSAAAKRLPDVERRLIGAPATASLSERVEPEQLAALAPIDDLRASAGYRTDAALTLLRRAIDLCLRGQAGGQC